MKRGSADDPFADDPADETDDVDEPADTGDDPFAEPVSDAHTGSDPPQDSTGETQDRTLPYIHARDGVKDGRTQRPVFLRDHVEAGIDELVARMEAEFEDDVYKTDVTEAAMAVAQENPEQVREKLDEWGYGWS